MKSNKNFQKSKKQRPFDEEYESRVKKVGSEKKSKNFKREIFEELDEFEEFEEIDLFGKTEEDEDYEDENLFDDDDDSDN
ncbi:MAG TPA: hypothetical protein P5132_00310 [Bacteroidales bacterium]|nr:hypothetical protein [Bacteroidales bacterium]